MNKRELLSFTQFLVEFMSRKKNDIDFWKTAVSLKDEMDMLSNNSFCWKRKL